jgi:hypothetical protein
MFKLSTTSGDKSPKTQLTHPARLPDSEHAQQPPQEPPYKPYSKDPTLSEHPYKPYAETPAVNKLRYEPYKGM